MILSRIGMMVKVLALEKIVKGSRDRKVRLPKMAATKIKISNPYFNLRRSCGGVIWFLRENRKKLSNVPNGHNQPHQALPKIKLETKSTNERVDQVKKVLLESRFERLDNGLRRTVKSVHTGDKPPVRLKSMAAKNRKKEMACVSLRAITHPF